MTHTCSGPNPRPQTIGNFANGLHFKCNCPTLVNYCQKTMMQVKATPSDSAVVDSVYLMCVCAHFPYDIHNPQESES
ncbi:hypothetical protein F2P81_026233 [Scophthalmus maximus]|uniref:Uncharacterized protein n=1 Tax=Scophthalmus maximus TaxID=52904 RepID=A0A6A4RSB5_SCOMX|nr:hypothetical protein F2P81_026233 [Scophthalmus maximus]